MILLHGELLKFKFRNIHCIYLFEIRFMNNVYELGKHISINKKYSKYIFYSNNPQEKL